MSDGIDKNKNGIANFKIKHIRETMYSHPAEDYPKRSSLLGCGFDPMDRAVQGETETLSSSRTATRIPAVRDLEFPHRQRVKVNNPRGHGMASLFESNFGPGEWV